MHKIERRSIPVELRASADEPKISGYSILFDQWSNVIGGQFRERIAPDAKVEYGDVIAKFNHDNNFVLGRLASGTLRLQRDERGIHMEVDPPETTWAKDLLVSMRRGDIQQQSFAFHVVDRKAGQAWEERDGMLWRTLRHIKISDVSVVTTPAYPQTDASVRSVSEILEDKPAMGQAAPPAQHGDVETLRRALDLSLV